MSAKDAEKKIHTGGVASGKCTCTSQYINKVRPVFTSILQHKNWLDMCKYYNIEVFFFSLGPTPEEVFFFSLGPTPEEVYFFYFGPHPRGGIRGIWAPPPWSYVLVKGGYNFTRHFTVYVQTAKYTFYEHMA